MVDRIIDGAFDAATEFDGRPPELFAGIARADAPVPVAYPSSCSPQAWSSASILLLLRTMLDLQPVDHQLRVGRTDLTGVANLRLERIVCGGTLHTVEVVNGTATVTANP